MPASALFEDFSETALESHDQPANQLADAFEKPNGSHAAFEDGYKEGWVDALAASQTEVSDLHAGIATSLQEAGFAYFEARQHIFNSMRPLLSAMVEQVMPELARETLGHHIVEQLLKIAQETEPPITVHCAPNSLKVITEILSKHVDFPVDIRTETTLSETQALIKFTDGQTSINLDEITSNLRGAVSDFYDLSKEVDRESA